MASLGTELERNRQNERLDPVQVSPRAHRFWGCPTGMTKEQVYKLQRKVGVFCVSVCVLSETGGWDSEKLHKAPRTIFKASHKEENTRIHTPGHSARWQSILSFSVRGCKDISNFITAAGEPEQPNPARLRPCRPSTGSFEAGGFFLMSTEWGVRQHPRLGQSAEGVSSASPHPFASDTPLEHWNALLCPVPPGPN